MDPAKLKIKNAKIREDQINLGFELVFILRASFLSSGIRSFAIASSSNLSLLNRIKINNTEITEETKKISVEATIMRAIELKKLILLPIEPSALIKRIENKIAGISEMV